MRRMSFSMTTEQVRNQTKTVTRRSGWLFLHPGDLLQPVVKAQGLKKGDHQELIGGPILVKTVRWIKILNIDQTDVNREGFLGMTPEQFIIMYCRVNRCYTRDYCNRIEFEYLDEIR